MFGTKTMGSVIGGATNYLGGLLGAAGKIAGPMRSSAGAAGMSHMGSLMNAARTPMGQHAMMGAGAGAAYGMFSDNTSMLGGAIMGAGIGIAGGRYGGAARGARFLGSGAGNKMMGGMRLMGRAMANDARKVGMAANRGYGNIRGMFPGGFPTIGG